MIDAKSKTNNSACSKVSSSSSRAMFVLQKKNNENYDFSFCVSDLQGEFEGFEHKLTKTVFWAISCSKVPSSTPRSPRFGCACENLIFFDLCCCFHRDFHWLKNKLAKTDFCERFFVKRVLLPPSTLRFT